ncbi:metallophosphoesterase [Candidatus Woesearchaeota archaeon]|nr:metallophosphoesterase [Candidatus Woesearchaeota archaeon]
MKLIAVSDVHGEPLKPLEEKVLQVVKPDVVVVLGDLEELSSIREVMELGRRYNVVAVPGNHDFDVYHNKNGQEKEHYELFSDPAAKAFIEGLLRQHKREISLRPSQRDSFRTIMVHGALDGELASSYASHMRGIEAELWYRLQLREDAHVKNFAAMEKQGFRVMLRGHDGHNSYVYKDPNLVNTTLERSLNASGKNHIVSQIGLWFPGSGLLAPTYGINQGPFEMFPDNLHAITVGDYREKRDYALIETVPAANGPLLTFSSVT